MLNGNLEGSFLTRYYFIFLTLIKLNLKSILKNDSHCFQYVSGFEVSRLVLHSESQNYCVSLDYIFQSWTRPLTAPKIMFLKSFNAVYVLINIDRDYFL